MAQVVIFAPPGEDVSVGKDALTDAGQEVEVVEATPENLLHMAIGMLEGDSDQHKEKKSTEEPNTEDEETPPEDKTPPSEDEVTEEGLGTVNVEGEPIKAFLGKGSFSLLKAVNVGQNLMDRSSRPGTA